MHMKSGHVGHKLSIKIQNRVKATMSSLKETIDKYNKNRQLCISFQRDLPFPLPPFATIDQAKKPDGQFWADWHLWNSSTSALFSQEVYQGIRELRKMKRAEEEIRLLIDEAHRFVHWIKDADDAIKVDLINGSLSANSRLVIQFHALKNQTLRVFSKSSIKNLEEVVWVDANDDSIAITEKCGATEDIANDDLPLGLTTDDDDDDYI